MESLNRRRLALALLILGVLLLAFGIWILFGMFWPKKTTTNQKAGQSQLQVVQQKYQPKVLALPSNVQGTSTAQQGGQGSKPTLQEAMRQAETVVARIGSGTSQDGFLGFDDAMIYGTANFRTFLESEKKRLQTEHNPAGPLYGMTTRVVSSKLVEGKSDADKLVVSVQAQKVEDAGNRSKPTKILYEESKVTLLKQNDGSYLVDALSTAPIKN